MDVLNRVYKLVFQKLIFWFEVFVNMLPNFVAATVVILFMGIFSKFLRRWLNKVLRRSIENDSAIKVGVSVFSYLIILIGVYIALGILHLDKAATSMIAGVGIVGLALSFAFQDLATNFISGLFILLQKPFVVGDFIETSDYNGYIQQIGLRYVIIRTLDEQHVIIPSKEIFQKPVKNYNLAKSRRINLSVGVSYGEDLERVSKIAQQAIRTVPDVEEHRPVLVQYNEFGDSSINFNILFWVHNSSPAHYFGVKSNAIIAIKNAFDAAEIVIPFPIRTLDFAIKAGESLQEQLQTSN